MISFTLRLPRLSADQQLQLEETLLRVPRVDAFALDEHTGFFEITTAVETLSDMVASLYSWASDYAGMLLQASVRCADREPMILGKHSPNDIIHYLATCADEDAGA
jgi:hypothetical protein